MSNCQDGAAISDKCCMNCQQYGSFDPRRYTCGLQELGCMGVTVPGDAVGNAAGAITGGVTSGIDQGLQGLVTLFTQALTGLVEAPFKALGIGGLKDGLFRALFILLGVMAIGFGLLLFAGVAIKEESGSSAGQQLQGSAGELAMAA